MNLVFLFFALAQAATPQGVLNVQSSTGASADLLPRSSPYTIQVVVRENHLDLDQQLRGARIRYLDDAKAVSAGGGTWFVDLDVSHADVQAAIANTETGFQLTLERSEATEPVAVADMRSDMERLPNRPPERLAIPLSGQAHTLLPDIALSPTPSLAHGGVPTVSDLDGERRRLVHAETSQDRLAANYRLGMLHLAMDLPREALHYLSNVIANPDVSTETRALSQLGLADAQRALGRVQDANTHCREAIEAGVSEREGLVCLARTELLLLTGNPTALATQLAGVAKTASDHIVVGALYVADHRYQEAIPHLRRAARSGLNASAGLLLGDSLWLSEDDDGAIATWEQVVQSDPLYTQRVDVRLRLAEMDRLGPPHWIGHIAPLERAARGDALAMADAHYGIARVLNASGDHAEASEHLSAGWDASPERFARSDAPAALLSTCSTRIRQLAERGRWVDSVSAHEQCWRPELTPLDSQNNTLRHVAVAYERLGLPDRALRILRASLSARPDSDNHRTADLVMLMHLYVASDKPLEALETMEALSNPPPTAHFVAAQAHSMLGQVQAADQSLRTAGAANTPWKASVMIERGILLANNDRCEEALPLLASLSAAPVHPVSGANEERYLDALLGRASCGYDTATHDMAYRDARALLEHELATDVHKERAAWIIANAGVPEEADAVVTAGLSGRVLALRDEVSDLTKRLEERGVSFNN